jgi:hypothetical protein
MLVRATWQLVLLVGLSVPAAAQVPTDTELTAAYCLGWWTAGRLRAARERPDFLDRARKSAARDLNERIARLEDYLDAKGAFGPRDPLPLLIARKNGEEDYSRCVARVSEQEECIDQRCGPRTTTKDKKPTPQWWNCYVQCMPQPCRGGQTCEAFKLPY